MSGFAVFWIVWTKHTYFFGMTGSQWYYKFKYPNLDQEGKKMILFGCDDDVLAFNFFIFHAGSGLTSAGAKAQRSPRLAARAAPSEVGRSRITADAPFFTRRSTVARPKPDAPPVTRPTMPCRTHTHRERAGTGRWLRDRYTQKTERCVEIN